MLGVESVYTRPAGFIARFLACAGIQDCWTESVEQQTNTSNMKRVSVTWQSMGGVQGA